MQVSSSGESIVFDAKTQKAIDEGKNRVTMLSAETVRLHDLKVDIEGQIVRLNTDIAEKQTIHAELSKNIEEISKKEKQILVDEVNELIRQRDLLKEESKEEKVRLAKESATLREAQLSLDSREFEIHNKETALVKKEADLKVNADSVDRKMQAIKDLLSKL